MSKQKLNGAEIGTGFQQVRGSCAGYSTLLQANENDVKVMPG